MFTCEMFTCFVWCLMQFALCLSNVPYLKCFFVNNGLLFKFWAKHYANYSFEVFLMLSWILLCILLMSFKLQNFLFMLWKNQKLFLFFFCKNNMQIFLFMPDSMWKKQKLILFLFCNFLSIVCISIDVVFVLLMLYM